MRPVLESNGTLEDKLRQIGDTIVIKLVDWIRRLPFYDDIDIKNNSHLLTNKFHEIVVITTCAYHAIHLSHLSQVSLLTEEDLRTLSPREIEEKKLMERRIQVSNDCDEAPEQLETWHRKIKEVQFYHFYFFLFFISSSIHNPWLYAMPPKVHYCEKHIHAPFNSRSLQVT